MVQIKKVFSLCRMVHGENTLKTQRLVIFSNQKEIP